MLVLSSGINGLLKEAAMSDTNQLRRDREKKKW